MLAGRPRWSLEVGKGQQTGWCQCFLGDRSAKPAANRLRRPVNHIAGFSKVQQSKDDNGPSDELFGSKHVCCKTPRSCIPHRNCPESNEADPVENWLLLTSHLFPHEPRCADPTYSILLPLQTCCVEWMAVS